MPDDPYAMCSADPLLDTPPPTSQLRRPWSPDPYDPLPSASTSRGQQVNHYASHHNNDDGNHSLYPPSRSYSQRREASDVSVEALDPADYARTLQIGHTEDLSPPPNLYRGSPSSSARHFASRDPFQIPSLISRGDVNSSNAHSSGSRRNNSHRRPFSLPPSSRHTSAASRPIRSPYLAEPQAQSQGQDIDISHFPAWSRKWYSNPLKAVPAPPHDIYTPLPASHLYPINRSPFDPAYIHKERFSSSDPYDYAPTTSQGRESTRDLLPWSNEPTEHEHSVDPEVKEERIRMLEREFGAKSKRNSHKDDNFVDENGKPLIGTVDGKGNLVTDGPKKRTAVRVLQILLAFTASIPAIYAALAIKPKEIPPPAGKPPAFVLYILSNVTLLLLLYLFVVRPCCGGNRRKSLSDNHLSNGMMVLPVQGLPGGGKGKRNRSGGKGKGQRGGQGDVQVNLIVDPEAFGGRDEESDEDDDEGWGGSVPGGYDSSSAQKRKRRRARRRSVFAGLAMEEQWKRARKWAKKLALFDALALVLWGATFVFLLIGKRCPSGGFEGWCNAYNVSSAAACLLCVSFGLSIFFDVKDLHASKSSPRTRS